MRKAGRKVVTVPGELADRDHCQVIIDKAVASFGKIDILVNNAAFQMSHQSIEEITDDEWDYTFDVNIGAMFRLTKAAVPHMKSGSAIVNTTSINADTPKPTLLAYAATKAAIQDFTGGLAQMLADKGIRANCVAPGPIWTPLIPATMPPEEVEKFGRSVPMKRAGQPAELAAVYVMLASDDASYISGATVAVTGGKRSFDKLARSLPTSNTTTSHDCTKVCVRQFGFIKNYSIRTTLSSCDFCRIPHRV